MELAIDTASNTSLGSHQQSNSSGNSTQAAALRNFLAQQYPQVQDFKHKYSGLGAFGVRRYSIYGPAYTAPAYLSSLYKPSRVNGTKVSVFDELQQLLSCEALQNSDEVHKHLIVGEDRWVLVLRNDALGLARDGREMLEKWRSICLEAPVTRKASMVQLVPEARRTFHVTDMESKAVGDTVMALFSTVVLGLVLMLFLLSVYRKKRGRA